MTYQETTDYLFTQTPMFQAIGAGAYKPGLETVTCLSSIFGDPHKALRCIHVGGTNGKGSTAHTLAAVLQRAGYRTGLFTSPHLVDFRERIRVDGKMIPEGDVCSFVERFLNDSHGLTPSFFELTTVMAFDYFRRSGVDVAVIEVGLGGRLDSTNIIMPDLSVITNISLDHTALLGKTPAAIASEKAGIIKPGVPVVIGESEGDVRAVFAAKAAEAGSKAIFADDSGIYGHADVYDDHIYYRSTPWGDFSGELCGDCQTKNAATIMCALAELQNIGYRIAPEDVAAGFSDVCRLTGLAGRWMKVASDTDVFCDTGHNVGGWQYLAPKLKGFGSRLHMVIGFVNDKDIDSILPLMPDEACYHFVQPSVARGLDSAILAAHAARYGLSGTVSLSVAEGYEIALSQAKKGDVVFVGGSTFVVADLMKIIGQR